MEAKVGRLLADLDRPEMHGATGRMNVVRALMLIQCRGMKPACARRKFAAGCVWHEFPTSSDGALLPCSSALSCMSYRYGLTRLPVPGRAALSFDYVQWLGNTYGPPARQAVHRGLPGITKCKNARNQEKKSSTGCRAKRYSAAGAPQAHRRDTAGTP